MIALIISVIAAVTLALLCRFKRMVFFLILMVGAYLAASQYKLVAKFLGVDSGNIGHDGKNMVFMDIYNHADTDIQSAIVLFPIVFFASFIAITFYMRVVYKPHVETNAEMKKRVRHFYKTHTY